MPTRRSEIERRLADGMSIPAIARELNLAPTTVSYHAARVAGAPRDGAGGPVAPGAVVQNATRRQVAELLEAGLERAEIARRLGLSRATVTYHARRLGHVVDERCARRYDWDVIQRYYDDGHSVRECIAAFGFSSASWHEAVRRGAIIPRPAALPMSELCVEGRYRGRFHLKARLIRERLKADRCEICGLQEWQGQPITLALHHVNGVRTDNRLENLQLLCPNCHSQTENFAGRRRDGRTSDGG